MKKSIIIQLIFLSFISSLFALDNNYLAFRITPRFEIANGTINEYVFNEKNKNTGHKESQLDWDVSTVPILGIRADFDFLKYIYLGLDASLALPCRSGNMQDYDWLNSTGNNDSNPEWIYDAATELTHYSKHDNELLKYTTLSLGGGVNIRLPAKITLTPMIFYYYEFISFDGKNGYRTYKSEGWKKYKYSGKVISYKQEINDMLLGLALRVETLSKAYFYADFLISPEKTSLNSLDSHYFNRKDGLGTAFWDSFSNIWQLQSNLIAQYNFNKYHSAGLSASIQYIPTSYGTNKERYITSDGEFFPNSSWRTTDITSGTGRFIWNIGLNYSFSL